MVEVDLVNNGQIFTQGQVLAGKYVSDKNESENGLTNT